MWPQGKSSTNYVALLCAEVGQPCYRVNSDLTETHPYKYILSVYICPYESRRTENIQEEVGNSPCVGQDPFNI